MKKVMLIVAAVVAGFATLSAQDAGSETFRFFERSIDLDAGSYYIGEDEAALTYSRVEEKIYGEPEYWFGAWHPYVVQEDMGEFCNGELKLCPVTAIGSYAVLNTDVKSFYTGNSVKMLYDHALCLKDNDLPGTCRLVLGTAVEMLGHRAIVCEGLEMLVVAAEVPPVWVDDESVVLDAPTVVAVPDGSLEAYKADPHWSSLGEICPFSMFGLDMFEAEGYVTYKKYLPKFRGEVQDVGFALNGDEAVLTHAFSLDPDCLCADPTYYIYVTGDYVTPDVDSYEGVDRMVTAISSYTSERADEGEFKKSEGFDSFDTGNKVRFIHDNAIFDFYNDEWVKHRVKKLRLGSSVKALGHNAFCFGPDNELEEVIVAAVVPPAWVSPSSIAGIDPAAVRLVVPDEAMDAYKAHRYWSKFTDIHPFSEFGYLGVKAPECNPEATARYYNLQGIEVKSPVDGIFIKEVDGTRVKVRM